MRPPFLPRSVVRSRIGGGGPFGGHPTLGDCTVAWKLNETSGVRADEVGSNDLTDNNTVGFGAGKDGNAADFVVGRGEYLSINDNPDISVNSDFAISLWVKPDIIGDADFILAKGAAAKEFSLFFFGGEFYSIIYHGGANVTAQTAVSPSTGTWYNVIWGWDSADGKSFIYVDDDAGVKSAGTLVQVQDGVEPLWLAARGVVSTFDGLLEEVYMWTGAGARVLTPAERTALQTTFY